MNHEADGPSYWQELMRGNESAAWDALVRLEREDHARFIALCHRLLSQPETALRRLALRGLAFRGDANDEIGEAAAVDALREPTLHNAAFAALATIATPASFPILLDYARAGYPLALRAATRQARTADDGGQVLAVARDLLFSDQEATRAMAVRVLCGRSSPEAEEDVLLRAMEQHPDEMVISALSRASPRVLPALQGALDRIGSGYAESTDLELAIEAVRKRAGSHT